ncbi:MAG: transglutaminase family protein [Leeuwenhoekiella sp.]
MVYSLSHITSYDYDGYVTYCQNIATLKPKTFLGQTLLDYTIEIYPKPTEITEKADFFGNIITRFSIQQQHSHLKVTARSKVLRDYKAQMSINDSDTGMTVTLDQAVKELRKTTPEILDARQFILESALITDFSDEIKTYAERFFKPDRSVFEAAHELMHRIFVDFDFVSGFTNVATPIHEVMKERKGVCQDFAQIAIACIRSVGLPARYVSGYIETLPPEGQEKLVGADASHAWFSIYIPGFGWVDFDPTNDLIPQNQHLIVAWGRDYYDVPPLKGVIYSSGKNQMKVSVDIRKVV